MSNARELCFSHLCYSGVSGAATVAVSLAVAMAREARQGVVLFGIEQPHITHVKRLEAGGVPFTYVTKRSGFDLRAYRRATEALRRFSGVGGSFIIHGVQMLPVMLLLAFTSPARGRVGVLQGPMSEFQGLARWKTCLFALACSHALCVSEEIREAMRKLPCARTRPCQLLHNGVDVRFWCPPARDERAADSALRLCFSGSLTLRKHPRAAVALMRLCRNLALPATLDICGDGPQRQALQAEVVRQGLASTVTFHGTLDAEDLREVYRRSHYLLHPSRSEGLSLSMLEAMACGCPVVAMAEAAMPRALRRSDAIVLLDATRGGADISDLPRAHAWAALSRAARQDVAQWFSLSGQAARLLAFIREIHGPAAQALGAAALDTHLPGGGR